jgi:hypothetical protein
MLAPAREPGGMWIRVTFGERKRGLANGGAAFEVEGGLANTDGGFEENEGLQHKDTREILNAAARLADVRRSAC